MKKIVGILLACVLMATMLPAISVQATSDRPEEQVTLSVLTFNTTDYGDRLAFKELEEKFNIKFDFVYIGSDTKKEKFNIMVQSGDVPDILIDALQYMTNSDIYRMGQEGVFMPLNDLVAEYGPTIQNVWAANPSYEEAAVAPDGNIYALPTYYYGINQEVAQQVFIESNFLKNVGMEMPTTIDEFYAFLKAVKEQDANGNGDPDDEVPMISWERDTGCTALRSAIMGAFCKVSLDDLVVNDGKVTYLAAQDGYKDGLAFFAKLYSEGLLYSEVFTLDRNMIWALQESDPDVNTIAVGLGLHGHSICNWDSTRWKDYEVMPALQGPVGHGYIPQQPGRGLQLKTLISANCKDPERAMMLLDYLASEEGMKLAYWGVEGHDYEVPPAGSVNLSGEPALYRMFTTAETGEGFLPGFLSHGWPVYQDETMLRNAVDPTQGWLGQADKFSHFYFTELYKDDLRPAEGYWPASIYYDEGVLAEIALLKTDLDTAVQLANAEFVMGIRDVEKDWDAYINELNGLGLARYLELSQQQYDLNKKN